MRSVFRGCVGVAAVVVASAENEDKVRRDELWFDLPLSLFPLHSIQHSSLQSLVCQTEAKTGECTRFDIHKLAYVLSFRLTQIERRIQTLNI